MSTEGAQRKQEADYTQQCDEVRRLFSGLFVTATLDSVPRSAPLSADALLARSWQQLIPTAQQLAKVRADQRDFDCSVD